jgi:hypothetical protein
MRIPRSRGAVSGLLLMILGAWGALIPFVGPYFDVVIGPDDTWNWSSDRFWLSVLPGIVAFLGGLILLQSAHRGGAGLGAWMGILAGAWFALGPLVSRLWTDDGASALGQPAGGTGRQVLEMLVMYEGLGVLMAVIAAFALGRLAVRSVRDVELAEAEAAAAQRREAAPAAVPARTVDRDPDHDRDRDRDRDRDLDRDRDGVADDDERFRREPAATPAAAAPAAPERPVATTGERTTTATGTGTDTTRVMTPTEPAREPATTGTRRSGGLLSRLRRG